MKPEKNKKPGGRIRVFVFDDEAVVRSMLKRICLGRGYEVQTFSRLNLCAKCRCKKGEACTDIVISDVNMPGFTGIKFLTNQLMRNCKVKKMALMSGAWKKADRQMAGSLDCKVFEKPIDLDSLTKWLKKCESNINVEERILIPWFLEDASGIMRSWLNTREILSSATLKGCNDSFQQHREFDFKD